MNTCINSLITYTTLISQRGLQRPFSLLSFPPRVLKLKGRVLDVFTELSKIHTGLPLGIDDIGVSTLTTFSLRFRVGH